LLAEDLEHLGVGERLGMVVPDELGTLAAAQFPLAVGGDLEAAAFAHGRALASRR
jgi:hypothetical protein